MFHPVDIDEPSPPLVIASEQAGLRNLRYLISAGEWPDNPEPHQMLNMVIAAGQSHSHHPQQTIERSNNPDHQQTIEQGILDEKPLPGIPLPPVLDDATSDRLLARLKEFTFSDSPLNTSGHSDIRSLHTPTVNEVIAVGNLSRNTNHAEITHPKIRKEKHGNGRSIWNQGAKLTVLVAVCSLILIALMIMVPVMFIK